MVLMDRRMMLKTVGSVAAVALAGAIVPGRVAYGQDNFLYRIMGNDPADPLTPALSKFHVGIRKLSEGLYVLLGAGGNIGLFDGPDGAIVIDSGLAERAKDIAGAIAAVAKGPTAMLLNTHYHFDHTGANEAVHALGYKIVAQDATYKHLSEKTTIEFMQMTMDPAPAGALPTMTFDQHLTLHLNGETIRGVHVAPAHTDSDAYYHFEKANVVQTGDLFFNGFYPFIDYSTRGSLDGMISAEEKLLVLIDEKTKLIPGHGPVGGKADLQAAHDMLTQVRDTMTPLVKSGKSVEEVVAANPLASLDAKWGKGFLDTATFTKLIYMCLTHAAKK